MTHAEMMKRGEAYRAACKAFFNECPPQEEVVEVVPITWECQREVHGDSVLTVRYKLWLGGRHQYALDMDRVPAETIVRFLEIREALQRWNRNEGPWPLAKP